MAAGFGVSTPLDRTPEKDFGLFCPHREIATSNPNTLRNTVLPPTLSRTFLDLNIYLASQPDTWPFYSQRRSQLYALHSHGPQRLSSLQRITSPALPQVPRFSPTPPTLLDVACSSVTPPALPNPVTIPSNFTVSSSSAARTERKKDASQRRATSAPYSKSPRTQAHYFSVETLCGATLLTTPLCHIRNKETLKMVRGIEARKL